MAKKLIIIVIILVVGALFVMFGCNGAKDSKSGASSEQSEPEPAPGSPEDNRIKITSNMRWLIMACVVGIGASVALLISGNKWGIAGIAGSVASIGAGIMISQHLVLISWICLIIGLGIFGVLIWQAWINRRAIVEVIKTTELAKAGMPELERSALFGTADLSGRAGLIQKAPTIKIVSKVREDLKRAEKDAP